MARQWWYGWRLPKRGRWRLELPQLNERGYVNLGAIAHTLVTLFWVVFGGLTVKTAGVPSALPSSTTGPFEPVFNVRNYGATGLGVADDRAAIVAAQAAAQAAGGIVFFPAGNYLVSDYIDLGPTTTWQGVGIPKISGGLPGTTITATGIGKGVVRYRPGTPGNIGPVAGEGQVILRDLLLAGGATTGHLAHMARLTNLFFEKVGLVNSIGNGLKDDNVTSIPASGLYLFGTEIVVLQGCLFSGQTVGAGFCGEASVHDVTCIGTHYNNNLHQIRAIGADNGLWTFEGSHFQGGQEVLFGDTGNLYQVTFMDCWAELQTGSPAIANVSGAGNNQGIYFLYCNFIGTAAKTAIAFGAVDSLFAIANRFNNWNLVWSTGIGTNGGDNLELGNVYISVGTVFGSNSPTANGFTVTYNGQALRLGQLQDGANILIWGASVAVDLTKGNHCFLTATSNIAATLAVPTTVPLALFSQPLWVTILNSSGGALTTPVAFAGGAGGFKTSGGVSPANTFRIAVEFAYDQVNNVWVEQSRGVAV